MTKVKLFDSHVHIFETPYGAIFNNNYIKYGKKGEFSLLNEYRKKFNIIGAFAIAYEDQRCPQNNKFVSNLANENKWLYPFGHIRKGKGGFLTQAKKVIKMGHFGVSLYLDKDDTGNWLYSDNMKPYWEFLKRFAIPMSINMKASQTRSLARVARRYPAQVFILSHMLRPIVTEGKFNKKTYKPALSLREFENVYIKLSGFYAFVKEGWRYPQKELFEVISFLKKTFGTKRLVWGSDFPPLLEFSTYQQSFEIINTEYSGFTKEELERVFFKNSLEIISQRKKWTRQSTAT